MQITLDENGLADVPKGMIATVKTYLAIDDPTADRRPAPQGVHLRKDDKPEADWYRDLMRRIGENYLWHDRRSLGDADLLEVICADNVEIYCAHRDGVDEGLCEFRYHADAPILEIDYFGLTPTETGQGTGKWLMSQAIAMAAENRDIARLQLNTCTLDSAAALPFYQAMGFVGYKRKIEIVPDPRADGPLPKTAAPLIPIL